MNTQAVVLQKQFDQRINGSFHGLWSTGGIVGVGFSTIMIALEVPMHLHMMMVSVLVLLATLFSSRFLLRQDRSRSENKLVMGRPDPYVGYLGLLIFFASLCEGGMFDWSGIYFKEVIKAELFTLGYLIFMIFMAISRFASDRIIEKMGISTIFKVCAFSIFIGIGFAIVYPNFWLSLIGFCFVGLGTAAVIPVALSLAAFSKKYTPGMAISIVSTYGIAGVFIGPPLIGYIAQAFNLRTAFIAFALSGLMLIPISKLFMKHQQALD
jgi:MFS family permease